jgi:hypothetical protein
VEKLIKIVVLQVVVMNIGMVTIALKELLLKDAHQQLVHDKLNSGYIISFKIKNKLKTIRLRDSYWNLPIK